MVLFVYQGVDQAGKPVSGEEFGETQAVVITNLQGKGISVIEIRAQVASHEFSLGKLFRHVSSKEMRFFYNNFATLINAGIALRSGLFALSEQIENVYFADVLRQMASSIERGKSFSESLAIFPNLFSPLFIALVKAGEEGGMLDSILLQYAAYADSQDKIKSRVAGALVLPGIVSMVAVIVVVALLTFVFPTFMELFKDKPQLLPAPTKWVMACSVFLRYHYLQLLGCILLFIICLYNILKTKGGWVAFCKIQLKLPLLGNLFRRMYLARFSHTLSALLKGSVPIIRALDLTIGIIPNVLIANAIMRIRESVEKGGGFALPMSMEKDIFPSMVILMVHVGETTGNFDKMLEKVGLYYDEEVNDAINIILTSIEPIMTVLIGGVVLIISMAMFLPMFNLTQAMR
ncbi:MAG: type II secretion system F family protein [Candidatus Riflebacteria bacterium]|nr:type II secretion system F family protein [Candidatus Riflebacteria bacterium]